MSPAHFSGPALGLLSAGSSLITGNMVFPKEARLS